VGMDHLLSKESSLDIFVNPFGNPFTL
jgi:hypothetical protein